MKCCSLRLQKPLSSYLSLRKVHMDSNSYRFGHFPIPNLFNKYFARHLSDVQKFGPEDLQIKSLSRSPIFKKGYIHIAQTNEYIEGQWALTSKLPPEVEGDVCFCKK